MFVVQDRVDTAWIVAADEPAAIARFVREVYFRDDWERETAAFAVPDEWHRVTEVDLTVESLVAIRSVL